MTSKSYFKQRIGFLMINCILVVAMMLFMMFLGVKWTWCIAMGCVWLMPLGLYMILEYMKYKKYYQELNDILDELSPKYLLPEVIEEPDFVEGQPFYDALTCMSKEMHEKVKYYENEQRDYKEYIESWIHEIKTPIASAQLIIENNTGPVTYKLENEINQIEGFVEQALYYARSSEVSKDYHIKSFVLRGAVISVVKAYSRVLIQNHIRIELGDLTQNVNSDSKWVEFILGQIIGNSIKYSGEKDCFIKIDAYEAKDQVILMIEDNGIGIDSKDLRRIFDKGFTGENGRKVRKSTGIGLYLCKKLCTKLGIGIQVESEYGKGTKVQLIFPIGSLTLMK